MPKRFAVLDLGSNTFHLLIVEKSANKEFKEVYRERVYTQLSKGGGLVISQKSYSKGIECLKGFRAKMNEFKAIEYLAMGTATLRAASNGSDFMAEANELADIKIELIPGKKEAEYITKGVLKATGNLEGHNLIIDIGGGSVEFILLHQNQIIWLESFKVGLGVLKHRFHQSDPITSDEIAAIDEFLNQTLASLKSELKNVGKIHSLIGASGSFEVIQQILKLKPRNFSQNNQLPLSYSCHVLDIHTIKENILPLDHDQRIKNPSIPEERADLMAVALLLIDWTIRESGCEQVIISNYAMKEGIIHAHLL